VEFEGAKNMTQLFSAMYDGVNSLRILYCHQQVFQPSLDFMDVEEICAIFPPADDGNLDNPTPPEPNGDLKR